MATSKHDWQLCILYCFALYRVHLLIYIICSSINIIILSAESLLKSDSLNSNATDKKITLQNNEDPMELLSSLYKRLVKKSR